MRGVIAHENNDCSYLPALASASFLFVNLWYKYRSSSKKRTAPIKASRKIVSEITIDPPLPGGSIKDNGIV